jgi:hypothetical protein
MIDGGHTPALNRPNGLADRLDAYAAEHGLSDREDRQILWIAGPA